MAHSIKHLDEVFGDSFLPTRTKLFFCRGNDFVSRDFVDAEQLPSLAVVVNDNVAVFKNNFGKR